PGRRGERIPEWLHPFSQPAWYIASRCVPHSSIPESMSRGDSPISRLLRIARVITLDSITQDSTRFSSRHYQRHPWLISLDGVLSVSENGQTQAYLRLVKFFTVTQRDWKVGRGDGSDKGILRRKRTILLAFWRKHVVMSRVFPF